MVMKKQKKYSGGIAFDSQTIENRTRQRRLYKEVERQWRKDKTFRDKDFKKLTKAVQQKKNRGILHNIVLDSFFYRKNARRDLKEQRLKEKRLKERRLKEQ
tara:strand:+ start:36 stop:338 length:303 start_codon:yes stop_codon:yes gene_type:complete